MQQRQQTQQPGFTSAADLMASRRQQQKLPLVEDDLFNEDDDGGKEAKRGLTSWDAVRWLSGHVAPGTAGQKSKVQSHDSQAAVKEANTPANAGNGSALLAGAAAALAATSASNSAIGGLLTSLLNPAFGAVSDPHQAPPAKGGEQVALATANHLIFLRAIFRIIFRVIVLVRLSRFQNSATPISALVLNELLR
ncbi:hypothetical protein PHSY_001395 [Pseudozyma hubeiensis SY62]|uniref:Uncharacterized protein n=1 Tax=Pseudozyma hubeiensis (strain SY62) TaxID=1305764 RepID=R9P6Y9_PSEHS|nr:hypothetical protein PHSY_001395 [Pseudozyma hubeiensis SY62]GAC93830.1 hypothetical protein PHSY_001395 [Pseudozyma hubeiensis SY62]